MGENALINHASKKILPENYRSNAIDVIRTRQKVFRKLLEEVIEKTFALKKPNFLLILIGHPNFIISVQMAR